MFFDLCLPSENMILRDSKMDKYLLQVASEISAVEEIV